MMKNYSDHASSERTYLSWVRTAITFMTFAIFIAKFEILTGNIASKDSHDLMNLAGMTMFGLSLLILLAATAQFYLIKAHIEAEREFCVRTRYISVLLTILIVLVGVTLFSTTFII